MTMTIWPRPNPEAMKRAEGITLSDEQIAHLWESYETACERLGAAKTKKDRTFQHAMWLQAHAMLNGARIWSYDDLKATLEKHVGPNTYLYTEDE